ncbi:flagellar assembly factor FliW [Solibacillus kalamii]|uniref:Flagellar assembly factor FliW n=1 Tax=Solibacillus kalamii TaxID=1748298 RepID=A0ABX3ZMQ1_9BACL|nr:flagellar assembly protein FliW [Solibacillus kalamii]MBM7664865.1 flagellar assembly factor FliW [Solibacillus kalamii]OUZ40762.1 flagellar assembly protein FliW [Solibacillus kalamii]
MKITTAYLGEVEINPSEIIQFEHGLPGFEEEKEFIQLPLSEESVFQVLQSLNTQGLAFIITTPYTTVADYSIELDESVTKALDIKSNKEVAVFAIVSLKETLEASTVNLKAPIILNMENKKAKQIILQEDYAIRHRLAVGNKEG